MKILFSPQVSDRYRIHYKFNKDGIIRIETTDEIEKTSDVMFVDVSAVKETPYFVITDHVVEAIVKNDELHLILVNFIGFDATEEESFPKEFEPTYEEFEIDAEVVPLECQTQGFQEPSVNHEVYKLQKQIQALTEQIDFRDELIHELAVMVYGE